MISSIGMLRFVGKDDISLKVSSGGGGGGSDSVRKKMKFIRDYSSRHCHKRSRTGQ